MQIANTFSQQGITAVIGHWSTDISYFLSEVYEAQRVVMITPAASGTNMVLYEYDYVFRMTGHNHAYAEEMARHLLDGGMSRVSVVYSDDAFGRDFAVVLESVLSSHGIVVVDRITSITPASRGAILDRWRAFGSEAIIMGVAMGQIVEPIKLIRGAGNVLPILGADSFDRHDLHSVLSAHAYAVYRIGISHDSLCGDFLLAFREAYGHDPDIRAVTGYMAVTVLADAMNAMGTTDSEAIVEFLTNMQNHPTIMGPLSYNPYNSEFERIDFTIRVLN
jgi:branched-chain amino acid transport system substrate-binding protein